MKHVSVFGGSTPTQDDYKQALRLGSMLAKAGFTVLTGGYIGSMEAISRGAAEQGGHVIGVTCDEIEAWRPVKPNIWVIEERRFPRIRQRLFELIDACDAAIAMPGGSGTLAEIMLTWTQLFTNAISPRPLILVGDGWRSTFDQLFRSFGVYIPEDQRSWLTFVPDVDGVMNYLTALYT